MLDQIDLTHYLQNIPFNSRRIHIPSSMQGTFSRIHHMLGHKISFSKFKKIKIIPWKCHFLGPDTYGLKNLPKHKLIYIKLYLGKARVDVYHLPYMWINFRSIKSLNKKDTVNNFKIRINIVRWNGIKSFYAWDQRKSQMKRSTYFCMKIVKAISIFV